jgi:ferrous iron transport protein A
MGTTQISLNKLPIGRKANVSGLTSDGATRRRMLDLGVIDGTEIVPLYKSPSGNPVAYLIRGAVIALRSDVSEKIMVSLA